MAYAVRMVSAVNERAVLVWTRIGVGWREGDHAGEQETRRHKFLLHHHSFCWEDPQARSHGRPIGAPIRRENGFRSDTEPRDFVAARAQHAAQNRREPCFANEGALGARVR